MCDDEKHIGLKPVIGFGRSTGLFRFRRLALRSRPQDKNEEERQNALYIHPFSVKSETEGSWTASSEIGLHATPL
jgi:hypothetical protein